MATKNATQDFMPSFGAEDETDLLRHDSDPIGYERTTDRLLPETHFAEYAGMPLSFENDPVEVEYRDNRDGLRARRPRGSQIQQAEGMRGMVQAGHGFALLTLSSNPTKPAQLNCRYCGAGLFASDAEWFCEFGGYADADCGCNWCECYRLWLIGEFRKRGRPRIQCGDQKCVRANAAERQRRSRALRAGRTHPTKPAVESVQQKQLRSPVDADLYCPLTYSDPVGDIASKLADSPPEVRELYYEGCRSESLPIKPSDRRPHVPANIFEDWVTGMRNYQAQVFPELHRKEKRACVENWSELDREMYCGRGVTKIP
jgi:hypothetical protein